MNPGAGQQVAVRPDPADPRAPTRQPGDKAAPARRAREQASVCGLRSAHSLLVAGLEQMHVDAAGPCALRRRRSPPASYRSTLRADRAILDGEQRMLERRTRPRPAPSLPAAGRRRATRGSKGFALRPGQWSNSGPFGVRVEPTGLRSEDRDGTKATRMPTSARAASAYRSASANHQTASRVCVLMAVVGGADPPSAIPGECDRGAQVRDSTFRSFLAQPGDPDLQRVVGGTEGDRAGAAAVVMGVGEGGQGDKAPGGRIRRAVRQAPDRADMRPGEVDRAWAARRLPARAGEEPAGLDGRHGGSGGSGAWHGRTVPGFRRTCRGLRRSVPG